MGWCVAPWLSKTGAGLADIFGTDPTAQRIVLQTSHGSSQAWLITGLRTG